MLPAEAALSGGVAATVLFDGAPRASVRRRVQAGDDPLLAAALGRLCRRADAQLKKAVGSVMDKAEVAPSGDRHDFLSLRRYWWPSQPRTPANPGGWQYVPRDGQVNPEIDGFGDHRRLTRTWSAIRILALAWYLSGDARYAESAGQRLRTWFVDPRTRMNPNMRYSQIVPDDPAPRPGGIITSSTTLAKLLDAMALLDSGAPGWTDADQAALRSWLTSFLIWMRTSAQGRAESAELNNHGTYKDVQDAALALYLGQPELARSIVTEARRTRLGQIDADGHQPLELRRSRSWFYSTYNLAGLCQLADVAGHVGVELWSYRSPDGGSLAVAVERLLPAAVGGRDAWPHPEAASFEPTLALPVLHAAAEAGLEPAAAVLPQVVEPALDDWPLLRWQA